MSVTENSQAIQFSQDGMTHDKAASIFKLYQDNETNILPLSPKLAPLTQKSMTVSKLRKMYKSFATDTLNSDHYYKEEQKDRTAHRINVMVRSMLDATMAAAQNKSYREVHAEQNEFSNTARLRGTQFERAKPLIENMRNKKITL